MKGKRIQNATLYASPAKRSRDLFCAFHPKRVTVPSLPVVFTWPVMPSARLSPAGSAARLLLIAVSVMLSINPRPNTGVGMRNLMLLASEKSGWEILQPGGLSDRPTTVKILFTAPSGFPLDLWGTFPFPRFSRSRPFAGSGIDARTNRTTRIGPSILIKDGTVLPGAMTGPRTNCGLFLGGLDPPTEGNA